MFEDLAGLKPRLRISIKESFYEVSKLITVLDIGWPHDWFHLLFAQSFKKSPEIHTLNISYEGMGSYKHLVGHYTDSPPVNLPCIGVLTFFSGDSIADLVGVPRRRVRAKSLRGTGESASNAALHALFWQFVVLI